MLQSSSTLQNSPIPLLHEYVSAQTPAVFPSNSLIDGFGGMSMGGAAKKQVVRNEESVGFGRCDKF